MRDERQLAVKDKTQKTGFSLKKMGCWERERAGTGNNLRRWEKCTPSLGGGEMKAILVSPRTQVKNSTIKLTLNKRDTRTTGNIQIINIEPTKHRRG